MGHQRGQVLAFFAIVLPLTLMPLAAYAVDSAIVSSRAAALQSATAQAAEAVAQQVDVAALRSRSELIVDASVARGVATNTISQAEPEASVESVVVAGAVVTVTAREIVTLPFTFLAGPAIKLEARASARLVPGYDSPSSLLPLPTSSF